jgi:hypothetical protein
MTGWHATGRRLSFEMKWCPEHESMRHTLVALSPCSLRIGRHLMTTEQDRGITYTCTCMLHKDGPCGKLRIVKGNCSYTALILGMAHAHQFMTLYVDFCVLSFWLQRHTVPRQRGMPACTLTADTAMSALCQI